MSTEIPIDNEKLLQAVADIKEAILQGQYEAAKGVNRIQLAVYFGIGKYISQHTRKGVWGTGALDTISNQLRRELPGLRGFSSTSLKKMRLFYENWIMLDVNSSVAKDDLKPTIAIAEAATDNQSVITDDFVAIDIYHTLMVPVTRDFPVEDFFKVPFTHHVEIYKLSDLSARYL